MDDLRKCSKDVEERVTKEIVFRFSFLVRWLAVWCWVARNYDRPVTRQQNAKHVCIRAKAAVRNMMQRFVGYQSRLRGREFAYGIKIKVVGPFAEFGVFFFFFPCFFFGESCMI